MEKKTVFLELPAEMIEKIDRDNVMGDRSAFITNLLDRQLQNNISTMDFSTDLLNKMDQINKPFGNPGEISIVDNEGLNIGKFNINTIEGFENLTRKISEISEDPIVKMRTKRLL